MPIFKADDKLVYYAHVPKCGGSAVSWYLSERFGQVAFNDSSHTRHDPAGLWSRTSPQHIDRQSLTRLFPEGFFDTVFTIVRHPVARVVSAYHFQVDVEQRVSPEISFTDWLMDLEDRLAEDRFVFDNHVRPMTEIVPDGAKVFYMEHGLDALIPWFDALTGKSTGPRALPRINEKGQRRGADSEKARPTDSDLDRIAEFYAADFDRFGYAIGEKAPKAAAPELSAEQMAERDAALREFNAPMAKLRRHIGQKLERLSR